MLELTSTWARASKLVVFTAPLLLGAATLAVYRLSSPVAALAVLAAGSGVLLATIAAVARRRVRHADERARLGEQALDKLPQPVFVVEASKPRGPNVYVNEAYAALTGYGPREAVAREFDALGIFTDPGRVAALQAGASGRAEVRRRDGTLCPVKLELRGVPHDETPRFVVALLEERKGGDRAADRKRSVRSDQPVAESPAAAPAKDAFLSWLSHELRSPLNACVMWLDVLALAPQPDKLAKAVDALKRNLAREARLVSDLSDAAKVAARSVEFNFERIDVVDLLKQSVDAWQLLAIGKQLSFHHAIEPEAAPVEGDRERLLQALNHLLESSIASTAPGGRVELRLRNVDTACIVEVEDTGAPLSAEDAANLALPLWRSPASAKTRSGLGLGLAVAHYTAVAHGGALTANSPPDGARFTLTLPIAAIRAQHTQSQ